uniref:HALZ domain-containing protein n=1 Tax=Steinernema glaseri TaxID=37863 RepID=A0A1I7YFP8_9BILA
MTTRVPEHNQMSSRRAAQLASAWCPACSACSCKQQLDSSLVTIAVSDKKRINVKKNRGIIRIWSDWKRLCDPWPKRSPVPQTDLPGGACPLCGQSLFPPPSAFWSAMVARPTVERWSRGQLEDEYHKLYRQNLDVKKKNNDLEKAVKQLNGRLRRTVGDGALSPQAKEVQEGELSELQRENHLLKQKLKSMKHQLLVYTRPGARAPMINSMTVSDRGSSTSERAFSREHQPDPPCVP